MIGRESVAPVAAAAQAAPILALLVVYALGTGALAVNALAGHPSPYLALHGNDPVDWVDWGEDALERARAENKPLFISSGYFACHWCHVMQRESFSHAAIAALLNRDFVPVKLDRQLHPDLDAYLISFVKRVNGHAGWPLNVFLTPAGYPIGGLTYAPPERLEGILERVASAWRMEPRRIDALARAAASREQAVATRVDASVAPDRVAMDLLEAAVVHGDHLAGGFGDQARFPMAPQLASLVVLQGRNPDERLAAFLRLTLDAMATRGLRDQLGGGFFRYTVDPDWQTPHFEKMLYTQALLVPVYLDAAELFDEPRYAGIARETLDFMLNAFADPGGGLIAALSAVDGLGMEGGYYLWDARTLRKLLTPEEGRIVAIRWGFDTWPPPARRYLPQTLRTLEEAANVLGISIEDAKHLYESACARLMAAREARALPRDATVIAGWNGLALSALVDGAIRLGEPRYRHAAASLADAIVERLWDGGRLHRASSPAGPFGEATLADYAYLAQGLTAWCQLAANSREPAPNICSSALHAHLLETAWQRFYDDSGFRTSSAGWLPGVPRHWAVADSSLPSPVACLLRHTIARGPTSAKHARHAMQMSAPTVLSDPFEYATHALLYLDDTGSITE